METITCDVTLTPEAYESGALPYVEQQIMNKLKATRDQIIWKWCWQDTVHFVWEPGFPATMVDWHKTHLLIRRGSIRIDRSDPRHSSNTTGNAV